MAGGGSTTFKRRKKKRGLEPDKCYWIANEAKVRGKKRIDLRSDPPPDLAIEVDVTHSSVNRMRIYAAIEVPEICRLKGEAITFNLLQATGKYATSPTSPTFPGLTVDDIARYLALRSSVELNELVREFRAWVRQQIAAGVLTKPGTA
jgi:Uma2 family endonuclease